MTIPGLRTFEVPCGPSYDVIYGLAAGPERTIYLSVSNEFTPGVCACVWAFDAQSEQFRVVIDFEKETGYRPESGMMPHSKVHLALQSTSDGRVFAATHFTAPAPGQKDFDPIEAYRSRYEGTYLVEYNPQQERTINYGCLIPYEGCRISALDQVHEFVFLLSYPKNHLFRFHYPSRALTDLGRLGQENCFGLEVDDHGNLFATDDLGRFLKLSWKTDQLEELDSYVPIKPGRRRQGNYVRRMTKGRDGFLYGFGNKGARLFRFCAKTGTVLDHGVIFGTEARTNYEYPSLPPAKGLAQADPETLYVAFGGDGIYADELQVPSLVRYNLSSASSEELGRFIDEKGVPAWIPQCALFSEPERAIYFGMQQVVGNLRLWKVELVPKRQLVPVEQRRTFLQQHQEKVLATPFGSSVEGLRRLAFVSEGYVSILPLGWTGEGLVIPPGESAVSDLLFAGGILYGVTQGRKSHVFRYAPYAHNRFLENYDVHVCDLGEVSSQPVSQARMLYRARTDELLVALSSAGGIRLFLYERSLEQRSYRPHYHSIPHWPPFNASSNPFREFCVLPSQAANLKDLVYDSLHDCVYSTNQDGHLTRLRLDTGRVESVSPKFGLISGSCIALEDNRVFALSSEGAVLVLNMAERIEIETEGRPSEPPVVSCGTYNAPTGRIVLGTEQGELLLYDAAQANLAHWIVLPNGCKVRAIATGPGAKVYGYCGADDSIGEIFVLDLRGPQARLLGIPQVDSEPRFWTTHRCDCAVMGPQGEVYLGEADRISHLVVYRPASEENLHSHPRGNS